MAGSNNKVKQAELQALEQEKMTLLNRLNNLMGVRGSVVGELIRFDQRMRACLDEIERINGTEQTGMWEG